ncbi:MAG TPA: HD domain-containing protein [Solirubrobacteraceae bacterium]|nr:HD domain-containing protein [Solirubrobacteraceae bacterium]
MSEVGSWAWAQRTDGRLSRSDRAELLRQGVLARLAALPAPWRSAVIKDARSLSLPAAPDTALARTAEELVRELSEGALYGHCLRTWAFAALFAEHDRVEHDEELLYLACVLHDLGLTAAHDGCDPSAACFAVEGARAAHTLMCAHEQPEHRARVVAEAISLHLNINVHARFGAIAGLLSRGVMLDVVGRRLEQLPGASVSEVIARWPRTGSGEQLLSSTTRQAELRPQSRAALLHRLGFTKLVSANPLDRA